MVGLITSAPAVFGYDAAASYAIPVDRGFRRVLEQLKEGREAEFGFLGIQVDSLETEGAARSSGVRIGQIVRGTPATQSGLRLNDVITHVDGSSVGDPDDFLRQIGIRAPAEEIRLTVRRGDPLLGRSRELELQATLSKKFVAEARPAVVTAPRAWWRGTRVDYATAIPDLLHHLSALEPQGCVAVVEVQGDSAAWQAGLRPNMFVTQVDEQPVTSPPAFWQATAQRDGQVTLHVSSMDGPLLLDVPGIESGME
jgi:S1-C subfamily serine protease